MPMGIVVKIFIHFLRTRRKTWRNDDYLTRDCQTTTKLLLNLFKARCGDEKTPALICNGKETKKAHNESVCGVDDKNPSISMQEVHGHKGGPCVPSSYAN